MNFENRSVYVKVTATDKVKRFFETQCIKAMTEATREQQFLRLEHQSQPEPHLTATTPPRVTKPCSK